MNNYDMLDFGKGVLKGNLMGTGLTAGMYGLNHFNTGKFILKRAGMVGVACMSAEALSVMTEFEKSALSLSEEYRDVMMYAAVDKTQKLKFAQNVQIMELETRAKLSESLNIVRHFKENPEAFGMGLGLIATPFVASKPISKVVDSLTQAFTSRMHFVESFAFQTATHALENIFVVPSPHLRINSSLVSFTNQHKTIFRKTDDLLGVEPASPQLIEAIRNKGRTVQIVKPGTDEYRYMQIHGWEANVGGEHLNHILIRENPSKVALLEEFLHGTQAKTGVLERFTLKHGGDIQAAALEAEVHVKKFMVQHQELLRLHPEDVGKLEKLYEIECNRLNTTLQRRFK